MDFVSGEAELIERFRVIGLSSADDPTDSASLVQASNTAVKPRMINIFFITYTSIMVFLYFRKDL